VAVIGAVLFVFVFLVCLLAVTILVEQFQDKTTKVIENDEMSDDEWDSLTKDQQQDWQTYWNQDGNGDYDYLNEEDE
jgi:predicted PurR-regulated permease PerM